MKSVMLVSHALVLCAAAAVAAPAAETVVDMEQVAILPQEAARFQIRVACAPGPRGGPPSACRALQAAAPTLAFRLSAQPTALDDADREALRSSATPMTAVLGAPITQAEALALAGGEICGRRIVETDAADQYGGAWRLIPYMYQADGRWVHRWTVAPRFAGYRIAVVDGRPRVAVIATREELERRRAPLRDLLDRLFSRGPF